MYIKFPLIIAIGFLSICFLYPMLDPNAYLPYGFYMLIRFGITFVSVFYFLQSMSEEYKFWKWTHGIIALIFNPFVKLHFEKEFWMFIDFVVAILYLIFFVFLAFKELKSKKKVNA